MDSDVLQCSVCLNTYNSITQRPFDLGCGHSFCEQCMKTSPRSFRYCPECRARASNPHANIALLRLLESMDGTAGASSTAAAAGTNSNDPRPQQQQRRHQQPLPAFGPGGVFRNPMSSGGPGSSSSGGEPPVGSLGTMLNQVTAAIPAAAAAGGGSNGGSSGNNPVVALPGSLATHKANIAQLRTSMWVYLTPLLGMLYILSPLDIIPDFIPFVGFIDDALVLYYVVCSLYQVLKDRTAAPRA